MKAKILFISLILIFPALVEAQKYFNSTIYIPHGLDKSSKEVVQDMANSLQKINGQIFLIRDDESGIRENGIIIQYLEKSDLSDNIKTDLRKDGQSFHLNIESSNRAVITVTGNSSLINGVYTFLRELGFKWYMPGEIWSIVPQKLKQNFKVKKIYRPDFRNRTYAGTGGLTGIPEVDPSNEYKKDYDVWNRRNRIGYDYIAHGHTGQQFYQSQKAELDKHPEYFCGGKPSYVGRIDIAKKEAVDLFVKWALSQIREKDPFPSIGVDPSDGSGGADDCLPTDMPDVKTWSDKYYWLANRVAENLPKNSNALVQLYAYSNHAATPAFKINKNVYPIIIPYVFQNVSGAKDFIQNWSKKLERRPMGIYDYWNITQWSVGTPQFNIYTIPEKLRFWKINNITSISLETTTGKGAMGHAFWLAFEMMWNSSLSFDSLYNQFLTDCFGSAAPEIKKMYDRWSQNYQQAYDANLSLIDLDNAEKKTTDPLIKQRITELKAYTLYLKYYYSYRSNPTKEAYDALINYLYFIHPLRLVQTSAIVNYYIKPPQGEPIKRLSSTTGSNKELINIYSDINKRVRKEIANNDMYYSVSKLKFKFENTKYINKSDIVSPRQINGPNIYQFNLAEKKTFYLDIGSTKNIRISIFNASEKNVFQSTIPGSDEGYKKIKITLPAGNYNLRLGEYYQFTRVKFPPDILFFSPSTLWYTNGSYPLLYIYVPKDVDCIIYEDLLGPGINKRGYWIAPSGKKVISENLGNHIYKVKVPVEFRGKVWVLDIGHPSFKVLNIPSLFALRPFSYTE